MSSCIGNIFRVTGNKKTYNTDLKFSTISNDKFKSDGSHSKFLRVSKIKLKLDLLLNQILEFTEKISDFFKKDIILENNFVSNLTNFFISKWLDPLLFIKQNKENFEKYQNNSLDSLINYLNSIRDYQLNANNNNEFPHYSEGLLANIREFFQNCFMNYNNTKNVQSWALFGKYQKDATVKYYKVKNDADNAELDFIDKYVERALKKIKRENENVVESLEIVNFVNHFYHDLNHRNFLQMKSQKDLTEQESNKRKALQMKIQDLEKEQNLKIKRPKISSEQSKDKNTQTGTNLILYEKETQTDFQDNCKTENTNKISVAVGPENEINNNSAIVNHDMKVIHPKINFAKKINGQVGLENLGNTCYMNSIIQCLSHSRFFYKNFSENNLDSKDGNFKNRPPKIVNEFTNLMKELWLANFNLKQIKPIGFRKIIGQLNQKFASNSQEDSHELLYEILKNLDNDLKNLDNDLTKKSFIYEEFAFEILTSIECTGCTGKKEISEDMLSLPLPMSGIPEPLSLMKCLDAFFKTQSTMQTCKTCQTKTQTTFKKRISKLPNIGIFQLQRMTPFLDKNQSLVEYPEINLVLNGFSMDHSSYNLSAVCNHVGSSTKNGHYFTFAKSWVDQKWYSFNDQTILPLKNQEVISSEGYILFYEKQIKT